MRRCELKNVGLNIDSSDIGGSTLELTYEYEDDEVTKVINYRDIRIRDLFPCSRTPTTIIHNIDSNGVYEYEPIVKMIMPYRKEVCVLYDEYVAQKEKVKEMTIDDIEKALGFSVKIVDGKNNGI